MTMDPNLRDELAAYVETDDIRLRIVRTLERKSEALTTDYFYSLFPQLSKEEVMESLRELGAKKILKCMTVEDGKPGSWDLTLLCHEILYALERPVRAHPPVKLFRTITDKVRSKLKNRKLQPAPQPAPPNPSS